MSHATLPQAGTHERPHPTVQLYVAIAVFLAIITSIEVAIYYVPDFHPGGRWPILLPALFLLSALKFATVVSFYMHLRYDAVLFRYLFVTGLLLAGTLSLALLFLMVFGSNYVPPPHTAG